MPEDLTPIDNDREQEFTLLDVKGMMSKSKSYGVSDELSGENVIIYGHCFCEGDSGAHYGVTIYKGKVEVHKYINGLFVERIIPDFPTVDFCVPTIGYEAGYIYVGVIIQGDMCILKLNGSEVIAATAFGQATSLTMTQFSDSGLCCFYTYNGSIFGMRCEEGLWETSLPCGDEFDDVEARLVGAYRSSPETMERIALLYATIENEEPVFKVVMCECEYDGTGHGDYPLNKEEQDIMASASLLSIETEDYNLNMPDILMASVSLESIQTGDYSA